MIRKTKLSDIKEMSRLMLADLSKPNQRFSLKLINNFREHASPKNLRKEFDNPNLIAFIAIQNKKLISFIAGYKKKIECYLDYISGKDMNIKKQLIDLFIDECKKLGLTKIKTDTFEFMQNNQLFKDKGFILTKKNKIKNKLEVLQYELNISKI